jgi:hypothetical protein
MALIRKRRLTEQQQRRIQKQQQTRQEDIDTSNDLEGLVVQHYVSLKCKPLRLQIHIPSNRRYKQVNLNRFGNRLNSAAFGAVIHAPTSNYWSQVIVSNGKPTQIRGSGSSMPYSHVSHY